MALEAVSGIGYSKLRVAFDHEKPIRAPLPVPLSPSSKVSNLTSDVSISANRPTGGYNAAAPAIGSPPFTPRNSKDFIFHHSALTPSALQGHPRLPAPATGPHTAAAGGSGLTSPSGSIYKVPMPASDHSRSGPPIVVGDVAEPFWVQPIQENSNWSDPDELFLVSAKRSITATDKKMFWEMTRALIDLPELRIASHGSSVRTAEDLTRLLKRPEFRVLWTPDAPQYLPKEVATELILSAYVAPMLGSGSADV